MQDPIFATVGTPLCLSRTYSYTRLYKYIANVLAIQYAYARLWTVIWTLYEPGLDYFVDWEGGAI